MPTTSQPPAVQHKLVPFTLNVTGLTGDVKTVTSEKFADIDAAVEDGNFSHVELRINTTSFAKLTKLNFAALLIKSRDHVAGMVSLHPDRLADTQPRGGLNPLFNGVIRYNGSALMKNLAEIMAERGFTFDRETEDFVFTWNGADRNVVMASSRRLLNLARFLSTYTRRFNSNKKLSWGTFDSITRLLRLPGPTTQVAEDNDEDDEDDDNEQD